MPKIPTYTSKGRITAEGTSVATNLRISPTASTAASLLPAADAITEYHIKQRDNNEKLEARKTFYEMKSESDKIIKKYENEPDDFKSVNGYNQGFVLRDKTTGVPITIDVVTPQGDFDEANYDDARFTYKEIVKKIYPLMKDKRYDDFVNNYNRIQLQKQTFDSISTETP